jgi:hypothetical protein
MKKLFKWSLLVLAGCFGMGSIFAVAVLAEAPAVISYSETNFNFGELSEMAPLSHDFIVKNGSGATLNIRDVQPS